jgi:RNA polymerase sigma factor (sigma-70 family)
VVQSYYAAAARRAGVPNIWVEDATQDIAVALWQANVTQKERNLWIAIIRNTSIDCSRHYAGATRNNRKKRPEQISLEYMIDTLGQEISTETILPTSFEDIIKTLNPREKDMIRRKYTLKETCKSISHSYGISERRVGQLIKKAFLKLRKLPSSHSTP